MKNLIGNFKKSLGIKTKILGIFYVNRLPQKFEYFKDTACTALARAFITGKTLIFGPKKYPQMCSGADYFLKLKEMHDAEAMDVYVNKEHVFKNKNICGGFIKSLPAFPSRLKNKFIVIRPIKGNEKPDVVVLLVNPAQAGRIAGLMNYDKYVEGQFSPNQPTCLAFFAPLVTKKIHVNFLDYYDRYYQGRVAGKNIWPEEKMIISIIYPNFKTILTNVSMSPHGSFRPRLSPQKVDRIPK